MWVYTQIKFTNVQHCYRANRPILYHNESEWTVAVSGERSLTVSGELVVVESSLTQWSNCTGQWLVSGFK